MTESDQELSRAKKQRIGENGLEKLFGARRTWYIKIDTLLDDAVLAHGPDDKMRCPDYLSLVPPAFHEAKCREHLRPWTLNDTGEEVERAYIQEDRWDDYDQYTELHPNISVILWIYVVDASIWLKQRVCELEPDDESTMEIEEHGRKKKVDVVWFNREQFDDLGILNI